MFNSSALGSGTSSHAEIRKEYTFDDIINRDHDYFSMFGLKKPSPSAHLLGNNNAIITSYSSNNDEDNNLNNDRRNNGIGRKRLFQWCIGLLILFSFTCGLILLLGGIIFGILVNANVLDDYCIMQFEFKKQVPGNLNYDFAFTKIKQGVSKSPFELISSFPNNGTIKAVRKEALKNFDALEFTIYEEGLSLIFINASSISDSGVFDFGQNYRNIKQVIDSSLGKDYLQRIVSGCN
ncbi:predicted protein [Naegleria gruberi]|uniref:Predicted protein n=1 Tax=Naegleria gruberi TaxID=5762 RepID=D2V3G3_NAEGR|nr:uncharacterized protein NAEGRDRAFT_63352 [Naegleria gruberi]EFC48633.1 predicted protein [Naegleria gruberi]|eukprot:XP_002681377.1 predicted protein [Naegleria gruberi strain NEG-M]